MKALIFGVNGQDGFYLSKLLRQNKIHVIGASRSPSDESGDVSDPYFVTGLLEKHRPDYIFHFAANSTTQHQALFENHQTISTGTLNILEAVRLLTPSSKVFLSGSAMQFLNAGLPIGETTPFEGSSPYSVARIQSVYAGRYYRQRFGLKVYVGYFFNHDSPLRSERHVNQKIVVALKNISQGKTADLTLGNIDVKKEFNFAGDLVQAVWTLVNQEQVFEAVLGCGMSHSIKEWLTYCAQKMHVPIKNHLVIRDNFTPEYSNLVSRPELIKSLGWEPQYSFTDLADLMMDSL